MHYTYILESTRTPSRRYIGSTSNLKNRLNAHNSGDCKATRKHRPWRVKVFIAFQSRLQATRFELYLKTGSGHSFAKRHFLN